MARLTERLQVAALKAQIWPLDDVDDVIYLGGWHWPTEGEAMPTA
jgi:hypothetical protein